MHLQTHIMAGWCAANAFSLTARERLLATAVSVLPDLDGLGIVFGREWYWRFHHKLGHNAMVGLLACAGAALLCTHRLRSLVLFLGLFHLHLLMDLYGSGPGWTIAYLWPFGEVSWETPHAWEFYSWQNISSAYGLLALWPTQRPVLRKDRDRRVTVLTISRESGETRQAEPL